MFPLLFCRTLRYDSTGSSLATQGAGRKTTLALGCFDFQAEVRDIVLHRNFNLLIRYYTPL
jgi:hypothetical protein